jgi:hypothetical protein
MRDTSQNHSINTSPSWGHKGCSRLDFFARGWEPKSAQIETVGALALLLRCFLLALAMSRKNLRVRSATCSNCRHSLDDRGWFGGDRFYPSEFYEQLFNLALFVRLGRAGLG